MAEVKLEDAITVGNNFKTQFPKAMVGFLPLKAQGIVRLEVRVETPEEVDEMPEEFEGYPVNTVAVGKVRFEKMADKERGSIELEHNQPG